MSRSILKCGVFAFLLLLPAIAISDTLGQSRLRYDLNGYITAGAVQLGQGQTDYFFGDFEGTLAIDRFQAKIGFFGVVGRLHESYVSLGYTFSENLNLEFGVPRPAFDRYAQSALIRTSPRLALETIGQSRSRITQGTLYESDFLPIGLTLSGDRGAINFAASLHHVSSKQLTASSFGVAYALDTQTLEGAIELVDSGNATLNMKLAMTRHFQIFDLTLAAFENTANGHGTAVELSGKWLPSKAVVVRGFHHHTLGTGAKSTGLGLSFKAAEHVNADVSAVSTRAATRWNAGLTLSF